MSQAQRKGDHTMSELYELIDKYCELERVRRTRTEAIVASYLDGSEIRSQIAKTLLPRNEKSLTGVDSRLKEAYSSIISEIAFAEVFVLKENEDFITDNFGNITVYTDMQLCPIGKNGYNFYPISLCHLFAFVQLSKAYGIYVNEDDNSLYFGKSTIRDILNNDYGYHFIARDLELLKFD